MTAIQLRNTSGKWKYDTTTDDPLFASLIGSMVEEGMTLGKELVIGGSLGEALEKEWKYVDVLKKWMEWEKKAIDIYTRRPTIYTYSQDMVSEMQSLPPPTLYLQDINVLSRALDLPEGWEAYAALDTRIPLTQRVHHLQAVANILNSKDITRGSEDITGDDAKYLIQDVRDTSATVLLYSFTRNLWLINRGTTMTLSKVSKNVWLSVTFYDLLDKLDWEAIIVYLTPYVGDKEVDKTIILAKTMTGTVYPIPSHILEVEEPEEYNRPLLMQRTKKGISNFERDDRYIEYIIKVNQRTKELSYVDSSLSRVYRKLLEYLPEDTSLETMGLDLIVESRDTKWDSDMSIPSGRSYIDISELVAWIHTNVLKYNNQTKTSGVVVEKLPEESFSSIVDMVGKLLGNYTLRRMLLSLLYYMGNETNINKINRADKFSKLIEAYLELHA